MRQKKGHLTPVSRREIRNVLARNPMKQCVSAKQRRSEYSVVLEGTKKAGPNGQTLAEAISENRARWGRPAAVVVFYAP
ncbi:hypothetical protein Ddc_05143 [Ditylenchus destructor]|nr:hypothetical protein Ddc_05143 [Ditylenchus destructor]